MIDGRREVRRRLDAAVLVRFENPNPFVIHGRLIDVSYGGFRMAHSCPELSSGQVVEFSHIESAGRARVIWNRIAGEKVETGFFVLPK